jgi:hypothetical protein
MLLTWRKWLDALFFRKVMLNSHSLLIWIKPPPSVEFLKVASRGESLRVDEFCERRLFIDGICREILTECRVSAASDQTQSALCRRLVAGHEYARMETAMTTATESSSTPVPVNRLILINSISR